MEDRKSNDVSPKSNDILLSIVIPVYNRAECARIAIDSVAEQLPADCECIVVDDGSDESCAQMLDDMAEGASNVHVFHRPHAGAGAARNAGIQAARGEFVAFLDGDDVMRAGFLAYCHEMLTLALDSEHAGTSKPVDLYIFAIERRPWTDDSESSKTRELWSLSARRFESASDFADAYVRERKLLLYSQCNKLYRNSVLEAHQVRFAQDVSFGEDRLFNYDYLLVCPGGIVANPHVMFEYVDYGPVTQSAREIADYFDIALHLHRRKIECLAQLSRETTPAALADFAAHDLTREIESSIERLATHPAEEESTISKINEIVFGDYPPPPDLDALIVLGSHDCRYRAAHAFELGRTNAEAVYIASGGNASLLPTLSEAELIRDYLLGKGLDGSRIIVDNLAHNTHENIIRSFALLETMQQLQFLNRKIRVGIVSGGFHMKRVQAEIDALEGIGERFAVFYAPAYGIRTQKDNWYKSAVGISCVLAELTKRLLSK